MVETSYNVVPGSQGGFDVQMAKPGGRQTIAPGFGSEHEANAWIVQAKRMKREAAPWAPLAPRKPVGDATARNGMTGRRGTGSP